MEEKIENQSFVMPRLGLGEQLLSEYDLCVEGVAKGRGSLLVFSAGKTYMLKRFGGSPEKAKCLAEVLEKLAQWDAENEQILPTKEGNFLVCEEGGLSYLLKTYKNGRECDVKNPMETLEGARKLADLHLALEGEFQEKRENFLAPEHGLSQELYRHNRELRNLKNYIRKKKGRNAFEESYLHAFDRFYAQAEKMQEAVLREEGIFSEKGWSLCHGDYHYHNVVDCAASGRIVHYENMRWDSPMSDLAKYMRKMLEKNGWDIALGKEVLATYERIRPLEEEKKRELCLRMSYPEKFWKIANHYNNNKKAWASKRDGEKLQQVIVQEKERQAFLIELYNWGE